MLDAGGDAMLHVRGYGHDDNRLPLHEAAMCSKCAATVLQSYPWAGLPFRCPRPQRPTLHFVSKNTIVVQVSIL
jgi:hypothetical protein